MERDNNTESLYPERVVESGFYKGTEHQSSQIVMRVNEAKEPILTLEIPKSIKAQYPSILEQIHRSGFLQSLEQFADLRRTRKAVLRIDSHLEKPTAEVDVYEKLGDDFQKKDIPVCGFYVHEIADDGFPEEQLEQTRAYLIEQIAARLPERLLSHSRISITPILYENIRKVGNRYGADITFEIEVVSEKPKTLLELLNAVPDLEKTPTGILARQYWEALGFLPPQLYDLANHRQIQLLDKLRSGLPGVMFLLKNYQKAWTPDFMRTGEAFEVEGISRPDLWIKDPQNRLFRDKITLARLATLSAEHYERMTAGRCRTGILKQPVMLCYAEIVESTDTFGTEYNFPHARKS